MIVCGGPGPPTSRRSSVGLERLAFNQMVAGSSPAVGIPLSCPSGLRGQS